MGVEYITNGALVLLVLDRAISLVRVARNGKKNGQCAMSETELSAIMAFIYAARERQDSILRELSNVVTELRVLITSLTKMHG